MVVRRYIDFLILLIPTPLVSVFFAVVYIYMYTDIKIIVLTRWGSLRLAPIISFNDNVVAGRPISQKK